MIVISDNSALSALAETGMLDLLPRLFGKVVIPESVHREGLDPGSPVELREWILAAPAWVEFIADPSMLLPETVNLGAGEAAAITLAWEHRESCRLILDEKRGRRVAQLLGLRMTGVVGIVGEATVRGLIDFDEAIERLQATGFHVSDAVIEAVRQKLR